MISIDKNNSGVARRLILSPNCSIRWRELVVFYLVTCGIASAIGLFFFWQGVWLIIPFSGLEMLVLGVVLYYVARKSHMREIITFGSTRVRVEKGARRIERCWEFEKSWVRFSDEIHEQKPATRILAIGSHGNYVEVGKFLPELEKDALAFQLKDCIIRR